MEAPSPHTVLESPLNGRVHSAPLVYITRHVHFNAAHRVFNPNWTEEQNNAVFGLCNNPHWHGHNYELEVTVAGTPHPDTGYVMDLARLKDLLEERILTKLDHRNLNLEVDFLEGVIPSTENLVVAIWNELEPHIRPAKLHKLILRETPRNWVEYRGESLTPNF